MVTLSNAPLDAWSRTRTLPVPKCRNLCLKASLTEGGHAPDPARSMASASSMSVQLGRDGGGGGSNVISVSCQG